MTHGSDQERHIGETTGISAEGLDLETGGSVIKSLHLSERGCTRIGSRKQAKKSDRESRQAVPRK